MRRALLGSGGKRYIPMTGWTGLGSTAISALIITEAPRGWQWTGIALTALNDGWRDRWTPRRSRRTTRSHSSSRHPGRGQRFTAGGLWEHVAEAALVAAAWPFSAAVALGLAAANCCGWGARGFYDNSGPTHDEEDAFAIDFTRYRRFVPYDNESGGTSVLAAKPGTVSFVRAGRASGDPDVDNRVEVEHADPNPPNDTRRFTSKYLHLEGPFRVPVSLGMPIRVGRASDSWTTPETRFSTTCISRSMIAS